MYSRHKDKKRERTAPATVRPFSGDQVRVSEARNFQPTIMIRYYTLFCKIFSTKKSSCELYEKLLSSSFRKAMTCPVCGSCGNCAPHGSYRRCVVDFVGGKTVYTSIRVRRVRCSSCGHTHAILPEFIVPYTTYSLFFILRVLAAYFRRCPVEQVCRRFSISPSMLYQWKALFLAHKEIWLGILRSAETAPEHFLRWLMREPYARFAAGFFLKTGYSFLQRRRNAARFRRAVF